MRYRHSQKQQGIALLTVMVVVALVAMIATQMAVTNNLSNRITHNIIQSDQAFYYAYGLEELGIGLLKFSLEQENGTKVVHLGQQWTQQLSYPILEGDAEGDDVGFVTGRAFDQRSCFNVNAMLVHLPDGAQNNQTNTGTGTSGGLQQDPSNTNNNDDKTSTALDLSLPEYILTPTTTQEAFVALLNLIGIPSDEVTPEDLAAALRDWIDKDSTANSPGGAEDNEYLGLEKPYRAGNGFLGSITELRVIKGYSKEIVDAVKPYICAVPVDAARGLPIPTSMTLNINTLTPDKTALLATMFTEMTIDMAAELIQNRPEEGYEQSSFQAEFAKCCAEAGVQPRPGMEIVYLSDLFELRMDTSYKRGRAKMNTLVVGNAASGFKIVSRYFGEPI